MKSEKVIKVEFGAGEGFGFRGEWTGRKEAAPTSLKERQMGECGVVSQFEGGVTISPLGGRCQTAKKKTGKKKEKKTTGACGQAALSLKGRLSAVLLPQL